MRNGAFVEAVCDRNRLTEDVAAVFCDDFVCYNDGAMFRHSGGFREIGGMPMDAATVTATCEVFLVVIGVIGLLLMVGRE